MSADGRLGGRAGLITGAASGIGAAGAELFAAQGAALVLVDTDATQGERTTAAIAAQGGRVVFVCGDAASASDIEHAVRVAVGRFGKLDLLWANAGIGVAKTVPETSVEEWTRVLDVNLTGAFLLALDELMQVTACRVAEPISAQRQAYEELCGQWLHRRPGQSSRRPTGR